ncbi:Uncharacterized protein TPAR_05894 [Tolypocladium paradoxum]|uniref:Uncharacterized protein n=1 Tax=Tolypocladium paradoxum TaxID=94208 RepID=A0A2S4KUN2_9HYPO|nr:Uncharacterized protein TPAR_05894 [Tolypocladium paradoxum]
MVMTKSKRAKRILRSLSAAQHEDHVLSCSTTPLIRYNLLHNYHRCIQVSVDLGEPSDRFPACFPFDALPNFLRSQLEAQKIADGSRLWSQAVPILTFIQANLRKFGKSRGYPTLFVWYSRENHRSYLFFAFVDVKMVSKTYSARELLRMRNVLAGKDFYDRLYGKLRKDAGLGEIFRMPAERSLPLIKEEDTDTSGSSDCVPAKTTVAARQLDGTDSEWKYRGRSESEENVSHPICGPAGLVAQKDKGFQRFYKAVVSPTHVRVTAGGRIVPNTRGSSSPTAKWAKDKASSDGTLTSRPASRDQPEHGAFSIPQAPFGGFPHMMPGLAPGMAPGMPTGHPPYPMMAWPMGVNMGGAYGMVHPHMAQMAGPAPSAKNSASSLKSDKHSETGNSENSNSVRISPPEQFDHSRPFFYNGQWVMPPGAGVYPFGMPPVAGYPVSMTGHPMMHPRFGMHPMMPLHPMRSDQSMHSHASSSSSVPAFAVPMNPPVSSILKSEITKRQLEHLRGHLKYNEDQLQYNKHQIDEKLVEQQVHVLRHQILMFEKKLEAELALEESQCPQNEKTEESTSSTSSRDGPRSKSSTASEAKPGRDTHSGTSSLDEPPHVRSVKGQKSKDRVSSQPPSGSSSTKSLPLKSALKKPRSSEPAKKSSTLPVSAALAPPFQPRTDGVSSASATTDSSVYSAVSYTGGEPSRNAFGTEGNVGKPYLVGALPPGCNPAAARDTDYMYGRDLTEDELRARHMYWGNAPRKLQKGFPKFDGKDFYPPSPEKGDSSGSEVASSPSMQRRRIPSGNSQTDYNLAKPKLESDPFGSIGRAGQRPARGILTQSEHMPRIDPSMSSSPASGKLSPVKGAVQAGRSYEDFRKVLGEAGLPSSGGCKDKSPSGSGDESNILFKGRRHMSVNKYVHSSPCQSLVQPLTLSRSKNPNKIWQSMLKKGKSSSAAVPGTVSSMTARGVLPNYTGHATASLTPTIANTTVSPKGNSHKPGESGDGGSASADGETKVENRPPTGTNKKGSLRRAGC